MKRLSLLCSASLLLAGSLQLFAAEPSLKISPDVVVRTAIATELASDQGKTHFRFRQTKKTTAGTEIREVIETDEGNIDRLISINGNPLSPEKRRREDQRLQQLVDHPDDWRAQQRRQRREDDDTNKILRAMPDAFFFEFVASPHDAAEDVIGISFRPRPDFHPPSREAQVLQGMSGTMEISLSAHRIVRLYATLIHGVDFGWGVLGHLDPGGHFIIEQSPIGHGRWDTTHTLVDLTGKILLVKDLNIRDEDISEDYRPVPNLGLAAAVGVLRQ